MVSQSSSHTKVGFTLNGEYLPMKGTASVISSNPQCKNGNARLTTVPLKPLFNNYNNGKDVVVFWVKKGSFLIFSLCGNAQVTLMEKP